MSTRQFPPIDDERLVVEEMLRDHESKWWEACQEYVKWRVRLKARMIPLDDHEEIVQDVLWKVVKHLPTFEFRCTLRNWLSVIIDYRVIDVYRRMQMEGKKTPIPLIDSNSSEEDESEENDIILNSALSTEDIAIVKNDLRKALEALLEYTNLHAHPERDRLIIQMVLFENYTYEETARAIGCNAAVVGYVVREARRYVRARI